MLDRILRDTEHRLATSRAQIPLSHLERLARLTAPALSLAERLRRPGTQLIAEIKRRSPSKGDLAPTLDAGGQAMAYALGGACALSVLTEPDHFGGSLGDLVAARAGLRRLGYRLPVLRKDFIVDPYQVTEARAFGADAVLLIVAALRQAELAALYMEAQRWGMDALVEVHDESELERALALRPAIIGINSRNLRDLTVSLEVIPRLRAAVPAGTLLVAESGIRGPEQVRALRALGVDGILVGEALVTAPAPMEQVRALVEAGR